VLLIARVLYHTPDCPGKGPKWDSSNRRGRRTLTDSRLSPVASALSLLL
jgi:hypothetical protein